MDERPERASLRRTWLRGYRASDVEIELARSSLLIERLQHEAEAGRHRTQAMQVEIDDLHARIDGFRRREAELDDAVAELRRQRDELDRQAQSHVGSIIAEAERRAATLQTEALRELASLQEQIEQLLALRGQLVRALRSAGDHIDRTLDIVGTASQAAPAVGPRPADDLAERLSRWTRDEP